MEGRFRKRSSQNCNALIYLVRHKFAYTCGTSHLTLKMSRSGRKSRHMINLKCDEPIENSILSRFLSANTEGTSARVMN